ncbi:MAG: hypothetical protein OHK0017_02990 [Patescibacteria group bacterium]
MLTLYFLVLIVVASLGLIITSLIWNRINLNWLYKLSYFLVLSLPFERIPSLELGGFNVRISQLIVLLGFYFLAILLIKRDKQLFALKIKSITWFIVAFWIGLIPSLFLAVNEMRQYQVLIATGLVFGAAFLVSHFNQDLTRTIKHLSYLLSAVGIFGIYQFLGDFVGLPSTLTFLRPQYTKMVFGFARVQATAIEPLYWGGMLLLPSTWFLLRLMTTKKSNFNWPSFLINVCCLVLVYVNLVLTLSRGAYLALVISLLIGVVAAAKYINWRVVLTFLLPSVLLLTIPTYIYLANSQYYKLIDSATEHIANVFSDRQASTNERLSYLNDAFRLLPENIVFGIGSGNYGPRLDQGTNSDGWLIVNNVYLEVLLEQGILAFTAFIAMFLYFVWRGLKKIATMLQSNEKYNLDQKLALIALVSALSGYLAQWATFSPIFIMPIFILLGLLVTGVESAESNETIQ